MDTARDIGGDKKPEWPAEIKSVFYWRMPQDCQRVMLFEKLEYAIKKLDLERR